MIYHKEADELGLYIALLPTWGDKVFKDRWGSGPEIFTSENARIYAQVAGNRYKGKKIYMGTRREIAIRATIKMSPSGVPGGRYRRGIGGQDKALMKPIIQTERSKDGGSASGSIMMNGLTLTCFRQDTAVKTTFGKGCRMCIISIPANPVIDGETLYEDPHMLQCERPRDFERYDIRKHHGSTSLLAPSGIRMDATISGKCMHPTAHL